MLCGYVGKLAFIGNAPDGLITEECFDDEKPLFLREAEPCDRICFVCRPFTTTTLALPMMTAERPRTIEPTDGTNDRENHGVWWQKVNIHQTL